MNSSFAVLRGLLARHLAGEVLSTDERASLSRDAKILRRRLARAQALCPDLGASLHGALDELAQPPVLSSSA